MTTTPLPYAAPVAALLAAEGTRRGLPGPLPEQALADALRRSQASVGQAKRRGAGVTVRLLAGMARALGWRLVLSVERDASAVLDDIVGPARAASVGAACQDGHDIERAKCMFRARLTLQRVDRERREAERVYVETADDDSAARGAGESEE